MTYLIDPFGINLYHKIYEPNSWEIFSNGISAFDRRGETFAIHHLVAAGDSLGNERHITLFPNPVEDLTRVAFHNYLPQEAQIRLCDNRGQLVLMDRLGSLSQMVDLSGLTTGVYIYEVWDGAVRLTSGKVVRI